MIKEQRHIVPALPQGGQMQGNHVESVVQITPEATETDGLFKLYIGCSNNAHVCLASSRGTQPFEFPLLNNAQEFRLQR